MQPHLPVKVKKNLQHKNLKTKGTGCYSSKPIISLPVRKKTKKQEKQQKQELMS